MDEDNTDIPSVETEEVNVEEDDFREKMFQDIVPEPDIEDISLPSSINTPATPKVLDIPISTAAAITPRCETTPS